MSLNDLIVLGFIVTVISVAWAASYLRRVLVALACGIDERLDRLESTLDKIKLDTDLIYRQTRR